MSKNNEEKKDIIDTRLKEICQWIERKPTIKFLVTLLLWMFAGYTCYVLGLHVGEFVHHIING